MLIWLWQFLFAEKVYESVRKIEIDLLRLEIDFHCFDLCGCIGLDDRTVTFEKYHIFDWSNLSKMFNDFANAKSWAIWEENCCFASVFVLHTIMFGTPKVLDCRCHGVQIKASVTRYTIYSCFWIIWILFVFHFQLRIQDFHTIQSFWLDCRSNRIRIGCVKYKQIGFVSLLLWVSDERTTLTHQNPSLTRV